MFNNLKAKLANMYKSLTIWVNGVLLAAVPMIGPIKENLPDIGQYLTPELFKYVGIAVVVANILLRFKTDKSLADK